MRVNATIIAVSFIALISCGESKTKNSDLFNESKVAVKTNYEKNKNLFKDLKSCLEFKKIKVLELLDNDSITIEYKEDENALEWKKIENKSPLSHEISSIIQNDGLSVDSLIKLKKNLELINVNRIWVIDNYDNIKGEYFRELDLRYKEKANGLSFFYRLYGAPLDSSENISYKILTRNDSTGSRLDNYAIWYYK